MKSSRVFFLCLGLWTCASQPRPSVGYAPRALSSPAEISSLPTLAWGKSKRLDFARGEPWVTVRLMEGQDVVQFSSGGGCDVVVDEAGAAYPLRPGELLRARKLRSTPAQVRRWIQLSEFSYTDQQAIGRESDLWKQRGYSIRHHKVGETYEVFGRVLDNRRILILLERAFENEVESAKHQEQLFQKFGVRSNLFEEVRAPPEGQFELLNEKGDRLGLAEKKISIQPKSDHPIEVRSVEYGVGYSFHNFENRMYRGEIEILFDRRGLLAVLNKVPLEQMLQGLVPAEIFPEAPLEALKAQAVTARGEVLAKVGLKHLADPYHVCAEQHCAVYKGFQAETSSTRAAVEQTFGEVLFSKSGSLVDSVYSAMCGGHTENNEVVWGGAKNANLRGKPDVLPKDLLKVQPAALAEFLSSELPVACRLASYSQPTRFRWDRKFSKAEMQRMTAHLGVGEIVSLVVEERGISGRATVLKITGDQETTRVYGELNIRRLFNMLPSSMFVVSRKLEESTQAENWVFQGGGFGHGVGMCQTGAIGRAEAGQTYREILEHYYSGAHVAPLYPQ